MLSPLVAPGFNQIYKVYGDSTCPIISRLPAKATSKSEAWLKLVQWYRRSCHLKQIVDSARRMMRNGHRTLTEAHSSASCLGELKTLSESRQFVYDGHSLTPSDVEMVYRKYYV